MMLIKICVLYLSVSSGIIERGILFFVTEGLGVIGADCNLSLAKQAPMLNSVEFAVTGVLEEDFNKGM